MQSRITFDTQLKITLVINPLDNAILLLNNWDQDALDVCVLVTWLPAPYLAKVSCFLPFLGVLKKVLNGEAPPRAQPLTLYIYISLGSKGTPFVYLILTNGTPFPYLVYKFTSV